MANQQQDMSQLGYNTYGSLPAAWEFTGAQIFGPNPQQLAPFYGSSDAGVPAIAGVQPSTQSTAGTLNAAGIQQALALGANRTAQGPLKSPLFWEFVLFALGLALVATIAHGHLSAD